MYGKQELQHVYDNWMGESIPQSNATYEMMDCLDTKYSDLINLVSDSKIDDSIDDTKEYQYLSAKVTACHQKLNMMQYAKKNAIECRREFETTQNMCFPSLFGVDKTKILFYAESTVLFARNALDIAATFFSKLLFNKRMDSFNDLTKRLISETKENYSTFHQYFDSIYDNPTHAYRLLCGIANIS